MRRAISAVFLILLLVSCKRENSESTLQLKIKALKYDLARAEEESDRVRKELNEISDGDCRAITLMSVPSIETSKSAHAYDNDYYINKVVETSFQRIVYLAPKHINTSNTGYWSCRGHLFKKKENKLIPVIK